MEKETCRLKVLPWYMKVVEPNFSKNQKQLLRIQYTLAQDEKYNIFRWNNYPKSWKVSVCERKTRIHLLACLLASCQLTNFPHEFTENCFAVFDQSSYTIYFTWYRPLLFFPEFTTSIPFMVWFQDSSLIEGRGYIFMPSIIC